MELAAPADALEVTSAPPADALEVTSAAAL